MSDMGTHSHPNGHRGEDGAAVATLEPFAITPALQVQRLVPVPQVTPERDDRPGRWQQLRSALRVIFARRAWLAAIPVILVNAVAFGAQLGFWRAHVPLVAEAVLVALALESIAIYLAWQAHLAQLADDSALRLRLSAYAMALLIGALNYSHFMLPGWQPTVAAVTFGMMSAISPWLWSVHSRRVSRDALKARGLIEPHAVRLGATRWLWHPLRCVRVMSRAAWKGESDPARAIALPAVKASRIATAAPSPSPDGPAVSPSPVTPGPSPQARHKTAAMTVTSPSRQPSKRTSGREKAAAVIKKDGTLTDREVAKRAGVSESTARRARSELARS